MADGVPQQELHEVLCPHCGKRFRARLLAGRTARHRGFKCSHCRLFVPAERVEPVNGTDGS